MLLAQGDTAAAWGEYRASLAIGEHVADQVPTNADWQRDLWVSHWKLASLAETSGRTDEAKTHWRKAYDQLSGMKQRGSHLTPNDEDCLKQLRAKVGD